MIAPYPWPMFICYIPRSVDYTEMTMSKSMLIDKDYEIGFQID